MGLLKDGWYDDSNAPVWAAHQMRAPGYGVYWCSKDRYAGVIGGRGREFSDADRAITNSWEKRLIINQLEND